MGDSQKKKETGDYNPWSQTETTVLVQLLKEAINNNWRDASGSFSKLIIETKFLREINKDGRARPKNYNHYKSRYKYFKKVYQSCLHLTSHCSGFGWNRVTKKFTADDEVWDDYFNAHPKKKHMRYDTFEFIEDLQIIFGDGVATGKYALGLGDGTDAGTYKVGEILSQEHVDEQGNMYDVDAATQQQDSFEILGSLDSFTTSECRPEKLQPKKRARIDKSTSKKDENPMIGVSNQILNLIQQREERQQKEAGQKKNNVWDAIKEISDLDESIRYKALTKIYQLGIQDVFVSMSVEERLGWIQTSME